MTRTRFAAVIVGLTLLATAACAKTTDLISVDESDPTCEVATRSASVVYTTTLKSGGPVSYTFTVTSDVAGEGVLASGGMTIPNTQTPAKEVLTIDRKATVKFTDQAGKSVEFTVDPKSVCTGK